MTWEDRAFIGVQIITGILVVGLAIWAVDAVRRKLAFRTAVVMPASVALLAGGASLLVYVVGSGSDIRVATVSTFVGLSRSTTAAVAVFSVAASSGILVSTMLRQRERNRAARESASAERRA